MRVLDCLTAFDDGEVSIQARDDRGYLRFGAGRGSMGWSWQRHGPTRQRRGPEAEPPAACGPRRARAAEP